MHPMRRGRYTIISCAAIVSLIFFAALTYIVFGTVKISSLSFLISSLREVAAHNEVRAPENKPPADTFPLFKLAQIFAGYKDPVTYLLVFQNSDEMRPAGGFIGSYGILTVDAGHITGFRTEDSYNLDRKIPAVKRPAAPEPIAHYLSQPRFYFRDANWNPDFKESAERLLKFYKEEGGTENPSGVLAVMPEAIKPILALIGSITVQGQTFTAENFTDALEYEVEINFASRGVHRVQRKKIISEFGNELIARLFALPLSKWPEVLQDVKTALEEKQVLVYVTDPATQEIAERENIAGRITQTDGDYLGVFDANMFSLKTDPYVPRAIFYRVVREPAGLMGYAEIVYRYPVSGPAWKTKGYRSWTRVYVPKGSVLVEARGAMEEELSKNPGKVEVSVESDKTVFGAFVAVQVGQVKRLSFKYRLPDSVETAVRNGRYELYVQKQPGTVGHGLTVSTDFGTMPTTWSPTGLGASRDGNRLIWQTTLRRDQEFKVEF